MRKKRLFFLLCVYVLLLFLAYKALSYNTIIFLGLTALSFLMLVMIFFQSRPKMVLLAGSVFFVLSLSAAILLNYGLWFLLFLGVLLVSAFFLHYYHRQCFDRVRASLQHKKDVVSAKNELRTQHAAKGESLSGLERRVDEIFNLFEVAKEFNECISFQQVGRILTEKVFYDLPFRNGYLVTLEGRKKKSVFKMFSFSERKWDELFDLEQYDIDALIALLQNNTRILQINATSVDSFAFIQTRSITFPIWIFPLLVEDKMIAVLILEGPREVDFSKFSIVAAQLALQVKKINLYNTVRELSITDGLTGVFLRRHFLERFHEELKRSIRHSHSLAVLMLDIDNFKSYNDTFGHLVGDVTLRQVSRIIKENVRRVDLIARYGGEEFALVLPETDSNGGLDAAERIRSAVSKEKFRVYDEETRVTVSIGFAIFPDDVTNFNGEFSEDLALELLQKADQALYAAKNNGRDRSVEYVPQT